MFHHGYLCGVKGDCTAFGIGPNKSACAEENAAEVACDNHTAIDYAACFQHFHHGHTGSTAGFAVIAVAHDAGISTDDIGITVVSGIAVFFANLFEKGQCFLFGFTGSCMSDETALVDDELILGRFFNGFVTVHLTEKQTAVALFAFAEQQTIGADHVRCNDIINIGDLVVTNGCTALLNQLARFTPAAAKT